LRPGGLHFPAPWPALSRSEGRGLSLPFITNILCVPSQTSNHASATIAIDLWQDRGVPIRQGAPRTSPSPICRRSLTTPIRRKERASARLPNPEPSKNELSD